MAPDVEQGFRVWEVGSKVQGLDFRTLFPTAQFTGWLALLLQKHYVSQLGIIWVAPQHRVPFWYP